MAKKFDKISPKNISEEKFNQLVDALPSSTIKKPKPVIEALENKEKADEAKVKKPMSLLAGECLTSGLSPKELI